MCWLYNKGHSQLNGSHLHMILYINTTDRQQLVLRLQQPDGQLVAELTKMETRNHAQILLPSIEELLGSQDLSMDNLQAIEVNPGPGSFTGTRVGVAVANALGLALQLPVNSLPIGQSVEPIYSSPPNIG